MCTPMDALARRQSYSEANRQISLTIPEEELTEIPEVKPKEKWSFLKKQKVTAYAEDGCYLLERNLNCTTFRQFCAFEGVLTILGLRFDPKSGVFVTFLKYCWLYFLILLGLYSAGYDIFYLIVDFKAKSSSGTLVYSTLMFQAILTMLFLTNWQRNILFELFFHTYRHAKIYDVTKFDDDHFHLLKRNSRQFWGLQIYTTTTILCYFIATYTHYIDSLMHPSFFRAFYFEELRYLRSFLAGIAFTVVSISMHTYICLTNVLYWEAKKFNYKISQLKSSTSVEMKEKLEHLIHTHTQLCQCIRALDGIYKIYAFVFTASVIPTTIFVLALMLSRQNLLELFLISPTVAVCVYEYYSIMYPARLHEELCKSKSLLCMNHNVWVPYEKSVNKVAHTLVMHLDQADLGISLWGFALVTKPLILTTVSAMMTCLAFFLDLKPKENGLSQINDQLFNYTGVLA